MIEHGKCGKKWTGLRAEHCGACHETFSGTTAGDMHRTGPMSARECLDPVDIGLVYDAARRVWKLPASEYSESLRSAHAQSHRRDRTPSPGVGEGGTKLGAHRSAHGLERSTVENTTGETK